MEQQAVQADVVELFDASGLRPQQTSCANPRCDEQFTRSTGRGRPRYFHSDDCQRAAEADLRRTMAKQAHLEAELEQTRAIIATYKRIGSTTTAQSSPATDDAAIAKARDAVAELRGMSRFLARDDHEYAADLLNVLEAVQPVIDSL